MYQTTTIYYRFKKDDKALLKNPEGAPIPVVVCNVSYDITNEETRYQVEPTLEADKIKYGSFPSVADSDLVYE